MTERAATPTADLADLNVGPERILYHYTSPGAFKAILTEGNVRMTHASFLNDPTENSFFVEALAAAIERMTRCRTEDLVEIGKDENVAAVFARLGDKGMPLLSQYLGGLSRLIRSWPEIGPTTEAMYGGPWVFCLSQQGDLLSQWRAYCRRGGYSIGIVASMLEDAGAELIECRYGVPEPDADKLARYCIGRFGHYGNARADNDDVLKWAWDTYHLDLKGSIARRSAIHKPLAFEEEEEWRLIVFGQVKAEYENGPLGLRPHIRRPLRTGAVRRVYVGPSTHPELAYAAGLGFCRQVVPECEVVRSGCILRIGSS